MFLLLLGNHAKNKSEKKNKTKNKNKRRHHPPGNKQLSPEAAVQVQGLPTNCTDDPVGPEHSEDTCHLLPLTGPAGHALPKKVGTGEGNPLYQLVGAIETGSWIGDGNFWDPFGKTE